MAKILNKESYCSLKQALGVVADSTDCGYLAFSETFLLATDSLFESAFVTPLFEGGGEFSINMSTEYFNTLNVKFSYKGVKKEFAAHFAGNNIVINSWSVYSNAFIVGKDEGFNALSILIASE